MDVLNDYRAWPDAFRGAALAIGNFDGVHRGHQAVIEAARAAGAAAGTAAGVLTFEPHPRQYFQPEKPLFRLTPLPLKLKLFEALGLDLVVVLAFGEALASLTAEAFVREVLVEGMGVAQVVTGSDFHFGKGREGDPARMRALAARFGFGVEQVAAVGAGDADFSSSQVRGLLRQGDVRGAAEILGYWWRIGGTVTGGDKRGHGLGFPTANIAVPAGFGLKHGIYAARVHHDGGPYRGAAYLGTRPSFDDGAPVIETFLFDFSGDLYGAEIEIEMIGFLRDDARFESAEALKAQMREDCARARELLAAVACDDPMRRHPIGRALAG